MNGQSNIWPRYKFILVQYFRKFDQEHLDMVLVLKEGATKEEIEEIEKILYKEKPRGGFDAKKYNGVMPFLEDGLEAQKKMRDEWQRDIS